VSGNFIPITSSVTVTSQKQPVEVVEICYETKTKTRYNVLALVVVSFVCYYLVMILFLGNTSHISSFLITIFGLQHTVDKRLNTF